MPVLALAGLKALPSLARFVSFGVVFQGLIRCHSIKSTFGLGESVAMAAMWKVESPMVLTQSALIKTAHSAWRGTVPHCTAQPEKFHTKSMTATDASQMKLKRICIAKEGKKEMEESQRTPPDLKLALRQARINTALLICRRLALPWWHRSGKAQWSTHHFLNASLFYSLNPQSSIDLTGSNIYGFLNKSCILYWSIFVTISVFEFHLNTFAHWKTISHILVINIVFDRVYLNFCHEPQCKFWNSLFFPLWY